MSGISSPLHGAHHTELGDVSRNQVRSPTAWGETERVAEAIIEDLFTSVLDWSKGDLMYGVGYADIAASHHLAKYLVIEVKRPGTLFPGRRALENAIDQARRYAGEQKIPSVAATDGRYLYAADVRDGGIVDRNIVDLSSPDAPVVALALLAPGLAKAGDCAALKQAAFRGAEITAAQLQVAGPFVLPPELGPARVTGRARQVNASRRRQRNLLSGRPGRASFADPRSRGHV